MPKPSGGILTSVRGRFFLSLQPPPPPTAEDYTLCSFPWEVLFLEEGLPQATPCSQENRLQRPWSPLCWLVLTLLRVTQPRPGKTLVLFCFFFPLHGPYLCLSPLGVSYQTTVGLELKSQTLATEAALEVAGLCREGLGRPVLFSGRRAAPEGYNSLEGIWLFLFTRRLACPLSPSVHFWDSSLQNSTGAQSSKYKGSRQRKQICPKAHN